jgi:uncharacterized Tic20 family protein
VDFSTCSALRSAGGFEIAGGAGLATLAAMELPSATLPGAPTSEDRTLAMVAHLITFVSSFIGPLVIYLVKKDESTFVADQAKEVLNFHLSVLIYAVAAFLSLFVLIGIVLLPALGMFVFVVTIIGAIRAYEGTAYRYPLCIRFIN